MENNLPSITAAATLSTGVLNDDKILEYEENGRVKYKLFYYTYANEWADYQHTKDFDSSEEALTYYEQQLPGRLESEVVLLNEEQRESPDDEDFWDINSYRASILGLFRQ